MSKAILLVQAGAGQISANIHNSKEIECKKALNLALKTGYDIIQRGGTSIEAVEAAVIILEDFPLFNAGKGSVIANSGICELDASIMDGSSKKAGAVACITVSKNPITVARAVMEKTDYVIISGQGANTFAEEQKLEIVDPDYFFTPTTLEKLKQAQATEANDPPSKFGTVGAVALDQTGSLAAATSTGGARTNKHFNRIGDSAIIGAGTYADNNTCAVSSTGYGEIFIRNVVAYDIAALMEYKKLSVVEATDLIIKTKLAKNTGGVIALDKKGNYAMPFNTESMLRGYITAQGYSETFIYEKVSRQ